MIWNSNMLPTYAKPDALSRDARSHDCAKPVDSTGAAEYIRHMSDHLDATGLLCPLPVLKARKRLMTLPSGSDLHVLTDDPAAIVDIPHFCNEAGHTLLSSEARDQAMLWVIRKA
jgi:tRNA 2-thiouridine synthesizing protein A